MSPSTKRLSTFLIVCLMLLGTILPSFVRATPTGSYFDTVVIVAMENQNYADVMGTRTGNANAPFISSLLPLGATIPSYNGYGATGRTYTGCSAACYVALTAGSTYGISDGYCGTNSGCPSSPTWSVPNLISSMTGVGLSWNLYCEAGCPRHADHFPFLAYSNTFGNANTFVGSTVSTTDLIAASNVGSPANLLWFTPTDAHNMHDDCDGTGPLTNIKCGDNFIHDFLVGSTGTLSNPTSTSLLATHLFTDYGRRVAFVLWWDEWAIAPILFFGSAIKPSTISSSTSFDHFSTLRMIEDNWGLATLTANDAAATGLTAAIMDTTTGNLGSCTDLPTGWNCGNTHGGAGTSAELVNGAALIRQYSNGRGGSSAHDYSTVQKGTFPWSPCQAPAPGVIDTNLAHVDVNYVPKIVPTVGRFHIYLAFYYWLPNGAVTSPDRFDGYAGQPIRCLDTQVRVESINGVFSMVGHTDVYFPGDAFGYDQVTIDSANIGISYTLTAFVLTQAQDVLIAWHIPTSTLYQLSGIEIGVEGFQFPQLAVDFNTYRPVNTGGGGGSVAAGTLITLADGTQVPVQNLQVAMNLLSYDMTSHQYVNTTITRVVTVMTNNQMVISTSTGKPLIVDQNPAQKLYVKMPDDTVTLVSVTDLKIGYDLFNAISQTWVPITDIHYQDGGNHPMYDIYTTSPGNYIANGYLDPLKT